MPADFKDYYKILGVERTASADEIKKAFRQLARKYHPRRCRRQKGGRNQVQGNQRGLRGPRRSREAEEVRRAGRELERAGISTPGGHGFPDRRQARATRRSFHFEGTGFSDFFEQMFGGAQGFGGFAGAGGRSSQRAATGPRHGQDIEGAISVTLEEAMHGSVRPISFQSIDPATGEVKAESFKVRIPKGALEGRSFAFPARAKRAPAAARRAIFSCVSGSRAIPISGRSAPIFTTTCRWRRGKRFSAPTVRVHGLDGDLDVKIPARYGPTASGWRLRGRGLPPPEIG